MLATWNTQMSTAQEDKIIGDISRHIYKILEYCLSIREDIVIVICGYDYLNFKDTVVEGQIDGNSILWRKLGCPSVEQMNKILIKLGKSIEIIANHYDRVSYVNNFGLMQFYFLGTDDRELKDYKVFGKVDFPSPVNSLGGEGKDSIHLNKKGYEILCMNCYDKAYKEFMK